MVTADLCGQKWNSLASCDCKFQIPVETFNEMNSVKFFGWICGCTFIRMIWLSLCPYGPILFKRHLVTFSMRKVLQAQRINLRILASACVQ